MRRVLVTGSSGLIGSEAVEHYSREGCEVHGMDNNMRRQFFGADGDTTWNLARLRTVAGNFTHHHVDIRDRDEVFALFKRFHFDLIVHCAAQPSHDRAADMPLTDFEVNAMGTLNLLEATRQHASDAVFIFMSTNKVYGDVPNEYPLEELESRWEYARREDYDGIDEHCRLDRCVHSVFGASKVAADIMTQEYGRYYGLNTGVFRGGCLTGPNHSSVKLHGFLSYLVKVAARGEQYAVLGYKGKQVRDQIHSSDVIAAFDSFAENPKPGEVYNLGGGRGNSASILECFAMLQERLGRAVHYRYVDRNRTGDHICYISDLGKMKRHFPKWDIRWSLGDIMDDMLQAEMGRLKSDVA